MKNKTPMDKALKIFGTKIELARAIGRSRQQINNYGDKFPEVAACRLHIKTKGKLNWKRMMGD